MPKKLFYEIVLDKMEVKLSSAWRSQMAESELRDFGEILELAELPEEKDKREVISRLQGFIGRIHPTLYVRIYLQNLVAEVEK